MELHEKKRFKKRLKVLVRKQTRLMKQRNRLDKKIFTLGKKIMQIEQDMGNVSLLYFKEFRE